VKGPGAPPGPQFSQSFPSRLVLALRDLFREFDRELDSGHVLALVLAAAACPRPNPEGMFTSSMGLPEGTATLYSTVGKRAVAESIRPQQRPNDAMATDAIATSQGSFRRSVGRWHTGRRGLAARVHRLSAFYAALCVARHGVRSQSAAIIGPRSCSPTSDLRHVRLSGATQASIETTMPHNRFVAAMR
jgi:hypothetical protein